MRIGSLRRRLFIWNIGVLIICLMAAGSTIHFLVQADLEAQGDAKLLDDAQRASNIASMLLGVDAKSEDAAANLIRRFHREVGVKPNHGSSVEFPARIYAHGNSALLRNWFGAANQTPPYDAASLKTAYAGSTSYRTIQLGGQPFRLLSYPVRNGDSVLYVVQVVQSNRAMIVTLDHMDRLLLHLIPLAVILSSLGGLILSATSMRPIGRMVSSARKISAENLGERLPTQGDKELADLAFAFNQVLDRLECSFEDQKRFIADASHELRTPLAAIKVNTSVALSGEPSIEEYGAALECADRAADRMTRLVSDLLFLSRSDARHLQVDLTSVDLGKVVHSVLDSFKAAGEKGALTLESDIPPELQVNTDSHLLERLLGNLISNALAYTGPGGQVRVSAQTTGSTVSVTVSDTGCGIAQEHIPHLFDRFYRADNSRTQTPGGTGLGLPICRSIAEALGGSIELFSELGKGTDVTVRLQIASSA